MNMDASKQQSYSKRSILVTVGTTLFDPLIQVICTRSFLHKIISQGYDKIVIQYGKGSLSRIHSSPLFLSSSLLGTPHNSKGTIQSTTATILEGIYTDDVSGNTISYEIYPFKHSLQEDMKQAHLILSHAGAGSIMEGLAHCSLYNEKLLIHHEDGTLSYSSSSCSSSTSSTTLLKKLVVVINDHLMDNHQMELAEALSKRGYLIMLTSPNRLLENGVMDDIETFRPAFYQGGNPDAFGALLNYFQGLDDKDNN
jgi:Uncharacterized conserved protein